MAEQQPRRRSRRTKRKAPPAEEPGRSWLRDLDARTALAQELSSRLTQLVNDLGGEKNLSYQKYVLCERVIWLEYHLRCEERKLANGEGFDSARWTQSVNALSGLLSKLGLERKASDVTDLTTYLAQREREGETER